MFLFENTKKKQDQKYLFINFIYFSEISLAFNSSIIFCFSLSLSSQNNIKILITVIRKKEREMTFNDLLF